MNAIPHREQKEVGTELAGMREAGEERGRAAQFGCEHSPNTSSAIPKPSAA